MRKMYKGWLLLLPFFPRAYSMVASNKQTSVAIIGGGVAGLSCAQRLADHFKVTVFDTGRLRPGGRCSSRMKSDPPKEGELKHNYLSKFNYDHAAQVLTIPPESDFDEFAKQLKQWEKIGVIRQAPAESVNYIRSSNRMIPLSVPAYFGVDGMSSIPMAMVNPNRFEIKQDVWVSPSSGARWMTKTKNWRLSAAGKVLGYYDKLIIAHNGKCADRLMSKTPATEVHSLLRVNFSPTVPANGGKRMTLNSIYSLTIAISKQRSPIAEVLKEPFVCGFVENHKNLRFLTCQTRKNPSEDNDENVEVWTILSSPQFASKYKAPQEFLPDDVLEEVTTLLLEAVEEALGIEKGKLSPAMLLDRRLQLWGAALPLNVWNGADSKGFIYDAEHNVGVCGDWLVESSVAGAWTSGQRLADFMMETGAQKSAGLAGSFARLESLAKAGIAALA